MRFRHYKKYQHFQKNSANFLYSKMISPCDFGSFSFSPHHTRASILWCNEWFYKVDYEDQICLPKPYQSVCQFSKQSNNVNKFFLCKILQVGGGGGRKKSRDF